MALKNKPVHSIFHMHMKNEIALVFDGSTWTFFFYRIANRIKAFTKAAVPAVKATSSQYYVVVFPIHFCSIRIRVYPDTGIVGSQSLPFFAKGGKIGIFCRLRSPLIQNFLGVFKIDIVKLLC